MTPPVVAIPSYRLPPGRIGRWQSGAYAVPDTYVDAVRRAGMRPVLLAPPLAGSAEEVLGLADALLLLGGGDVDPKRFGAEPHPSQYGVDADRDELEIELVLAADRIEMPVLAVCRGAQVVNVAFGGTLLQHLPEVEGLIPHGGPQADQDAQHDVRLEPGTRLAEACGSEVLSCLSHHHQALDRLGGGLRPVARSDDGLIEAVERETGWIVAVQWHPEVTAPRDPAQQALFDALAEQAVKRRSERQGPAG